MNVEWTATARRDLAEIIEYIAVENPQAALRMDDLLSAAPRILKRYPLMGKPGAVKGTRELLPHRSYRIVYTVEAETISVLAIVHTARRWPPEPQPEDPS